MQAAQNVLAEHRTPAAGSHSSSSGSRSHLRQLTASDLLNAAADVKPSVTKAQAYSQGMHGNAEIDATSSSGSPGLVSMVQLMAALAASAGTNSKNKGVSSIGSANTGTRSSEAGVTLATDAAEADVQEQEQRQRDELYRMIGKMVLGSMQ